MENQGPDQDIRDLYLRNAPSVGGDEIWEAVQSRLPASAHLPKRASASRQSSGLHIAVFASIAVVLVAAITVGSLEAAKHLGKGTPIVYITDDTGGISPGSTGETSQSAVGETSAAMPRGNLERTGVYPDSGPTQLSGVLWKFWIGRFVRSDPAVSGGRSIPRAIPIISTRWMPRPGKRNGILR